MQSGERQEQKVNWHRVIRQDGTVLAGDVNAHSRLWDLRCRAHRDTAFLEAVMDKK